MKILSGLSLALLTITLFSAENIGTVTGSRLNVRTKPMASGEVVCQLLKGEKVVIKELKGSWAAIEIPSKCQGWVRSGVIQGKAISEPTNAHLGPAPVFTLVGKLERGDTVSPVRTKGAWTLVKANFRGHLWVHADYLLLPPGMKRPVTAEDKAVKVTPKTGHGSGEIVNVSKKNPSGDVPSKPIEKPKDMVVHEIPVKVSTTEIIPISTAKRITKSGVVVKLNKTKELPFKYALASQINNKFYPLFYLRDGKLDYTKWELHRVTISGDRQWVQGYPRPVVEVRTIDPEKH